MFKHPMHLARAHLAAHSLLLKIHVPTAIATFQVTYHVTADCYYSIRKQQLPVAAHLLILSPSGSSVCHNNKKDKHWTNNLYVNWTDSAAKYRRVC